jgi:subfamily B ATP-binding cassette protein MsbA
MIREYLKLKRYLRIPFGRLYAGILFAWLCSLTNGISLGMIVPLVDRVFQHSPIVLQKRLPGPLQHLLESLLGKINAMDPIFLLKIVITLIVLLMVVKGATFYLQNYFLHYFSKRIIADLRNALYEKTLSLSLDYFHRNRAGEMMSRITYDINLLDESLSVGFPTFLFKFFETLIYLTIIFFLIWKLSLISIFIFPLLMLPLWNLGKKVRKLTKKNQETVGAMTNIIHEGIYAQPIIKAFNREKYEVERFAQKSESIFKILMSTIKRMAIVSPFTELTATFGGALIIVYGARHVMAGSISTGIFMLFLFALFSLLSPLKSLGNSSVSLQQGFTVLPRIFAVLDEDASVPDKGNEKLCEIKETIEFRNLSFSYGKKEILKNINLTVQAGEKIGIVGSTGTGKTTLTNLLLRFYDPTSGMILIDGTNIQHYTLASLRELFGLVTQEPILFRDTVRNNISYGKHNASFEEIVHAAQRANVHTQILNLQDGYDTIIGERGTTLSGGQKQMLTIARAILKNPPVLILDEATASLDSASEQLVQEALSNAMSGRTAFIIAHRLTTLQIVDRIIVIEKGVITESGSHAELLQLNRAYRKFWDLQTAQS